MRACAYSLPCGRQLIPRVFDCTRKPAVDCTPGPIMACCLTGQTKGSVLHPCQALCTGWALELRGRIPEHVLAAAGLLWHDCGSACFRAF